MTVNVGVIGAGWIGEDHVRRLTTVLSGVQVTAVADVDADRARHVAGVAGGARVLDSGAAVVAAAEVDAVLVTSWGPTHEEYVLAAIAAGKPVFCEKPLTPTQEGCLRIIDAEMAAGRRLVRVGFMRRYDAGYRAIKQAIADGTVGAPLLVHMAHRNPEVPPTFTSDMTINDSAVHEIDTARWLLDEDVVATTVLAPKRASQAAPDLQDPMIVLFESASGVLVDAELFVTCGYGYDIKCELVGEKGAAALTDPTAVIERRGSGAVSRKVAGGWPERFARAFDAEFQEWVDSVRDGKASGPSSWDGYAAAVIADACLEAQRKGERVTVQMKDRPAFYG